MSQNNFAKRAGISRSYLSQLMTGQRCPSPRTRQLIVKELGEAAEAQFDSLFEELVEGEG
jgi:transcriptional regulator with XRE-family HTH domain